MNVLHVTPGFYPATYWGGPIFSTYGLCNALAGVDGITLRVLSTDTAGPDVADSVEVTGFPMRYPAGYDVFFCHRRWATSIAPGMLPKLWNMIRWADVVHLMGAYSAPTLPTLLVCRLMRKPIVWSPRGALQRWHAARRLIPKRVVERIADALIEGNRCVLHATSEAEAKASAARICNCDVALIPNGVDLPPRLSGKTWLPDGELRLLYLGRLHPIKGIENLLKALALLADRTVSLTICGSGDKSYARRLRELADELHLDDQVTFRGYVDGSEKSEAFMRSDVCVVPSFIENFGMVVAEALAHAVPVIVGKGTPWSECERRGCGLWVDNDPAELARAISHVREQPLEEMGTRGRMWMAEKFSWDSAATRVYRLYRSLTGL